MNNNNFSKCFYDICKKNNINTEDFFVASVGNGKHLEYDFRNKVDEINQKYIVRYFSKYNAVIIWNRLEHKTTTKKLTVSKKEILKAIDFKKFCVNKGVEFSFWKLTRLYVSDLSNIEQLLIKYFK